MFALLIQLAFLLFGVSYAADTTFPKFSNVYAINGTIYVPSAEIREPFNAWYDGNSGLSRIDYYGGMVKTFQLSNKGSYGTSLKIVPVTTETSVNEDVCFQVNGTSEMKIQPQTIIPDTTGMEHIGEEVINGLTCEKWLSVIKKESQTEKSTFWIRYQNLSKCSVGKEAIPVRFEMKKLNSLGSQLRNHFYVDYEWYSFDKPSADVFKVTKNCTKLPGSDDKHINTFNPMREFMNDYDDHVETAFDLFKNKHNRKYKNVMDHDNAKEFFRQNLRFIQSVNRANLGYQLGVNHLADKSDLEIKALCGKQYTSDDYDGGLPFDYEVEKEIKSAPENLDWRLFGAVTPVKDQSNCGACWSFAATGAVEGAYFMKHQKLIRLSQQALIDCSWGFDNHGCDGGDISSAYKWIIKHGLPKEEDYGVYLRQDGYCHASNVTASVNMSGFVNVTMGNVEAMKVALFKHGPVSVAIDAEQKGFQFYANGVYYDPKCENTEKSLNHAVLVVGYGTMNGKDYWLVKNSWSNYWGNDGYILMAQQDNNCGVLTTPSYPIVK